MGAYLVKRTLISAANGKTGQHVIAALRSRPDSGSIRGFALRPVPSADETVHGDLCDFRAIERAVQGVDTMIHYGPAMHPRETVMGTGMIDAAQSAGVRRFIYISVIHPEIDDLLNHKAKLAVEAHLINSRLDWTVLRPQHYMQNIAVAKVVKDGRLVMPYPVTTRLGHVDMQDLAEAVAIVASEPGHSHATYDISGEENLSVEDICQAIVRLSGTPVQAVAIDPAALIEIIKSHWRGPLSDYSIEGFHRLFGYYARHGIRGNARVLTWLLKRPPATFDEYVQRGLAASSR
jgi:uncharacterized protein YbjT (DUF2867 family)